MKFLIVKTSSLGDILQTFPVVSYLRQKSPYGQIDWLVEEKFSSLVAAHPQVDRVLTTKRHFKIPFAPELRKCAYDLLFDLQGNCKSALLTLFADAKAKVGFGWKDLSEWPSGLTTNVKFVLPPKQSIRDDYLFPVQSYFGDFTAPQVEPFLFPLSQEDQEKIGSFGGGTLVCPGAAWPSKRLTEEQWIPILEKIEGKIFFVWGSNEEYAFVKKLERFGQILPKLTLAQLQNVMDKSKRVLAMDSLPLHLCATTKAKAFGFFGPSSIQKYLPSGFDGVQGSCPFGQSFENRCGKLRSCSAPCMRGKFDKYGNHNAGNDERLPSHVAYVDAGEGC
ncbi:MAG: hypothetical protein S4CHLAM81_03960 [Chlamydiales bacterium]|nr:hypothetical protein [Chlamydiales bacterium]MCH9635185.1 hypothetical protein [Chlamydiales bacterium]MCH9704265.1 glycosyltransferase family 9 protein [Chlamydiota bacterium]